MKKKTGILGVLIAILLVGIGYAAISAVTLTITGTGTIEADPNNFKVVYTQGQQTSASTGVTATPASIGADVVTSTSFTVSGMTKKNDTVTLTYTIQNKSDDLSATLAANPTVSITNAAGNPNGTTITDYFSVTSVVNTPLTLAKTETTTQTVTVTAIKTPVTDDIGATITITVDATPVNP